MTEEKNKYRSTRSLSRSDKLKIRKLYLADELQVNEIASKYRINPSNFRAYISNSGLSKEKKILIAKDNEKISAESNDAIEYKTQRQIEFYENLQDKAENLTEKALLNADECEGISELNTALASVKSAVNLFEESSAKLGESLQTGASAVESGNQYNYFFIDDQVAKDILSNSENSVQRILKKAEKVDK